MMQALALTVFPLGMIFAAFSDLFTMTIPNRLIAALLLGFVATSALAGIAPIAFLLHLAAGAAVLAIGIIFFAMGWIGGGDAKLAAVAAVWLGLGALPEFVITSALFGGALTLSLLSFRTLPLPVLMSGWTWLARLHHHETGIPYGIALAAGGLVTYSSSPIWFALL